MSAQHQGVPEAKSATQQTRRQRRRQIRAEGLEPTDGSNDEAAHIGKALVTSVPTKPIHRLAKLIQFLDSYDCDVRKIEGAVGDLIAKEDKIESLSNAVQELQTLNNEQSRTLQEGTERVLKQQRSLDAREQALKSDQENLEREKEQVRHDNTVFQEQEKLRLNKILEAERKRITEDAKRQITVHENSLKVKFQRANDQIKTLQDEVKDLTTKLEESNKTKHLYIQHSNSLEAELCQLKARYQIQSAPITDYKDGLVKIHNSLRKLVHSYFEDLAPEDLDVESASLLLNLDGIFKYIPLTTSDVSKFLRTCGAQSVIIKAICGYLWQPFSPAGLSISPGVKDTLQRVSEGLAQEDRSKEALWRNLTYHVLDPLSEDPNDPSRHKQILQDFKAITDGLTEIIPRKRHKGFEHELHQLLAECLHLWSKAQRDSCRIEFDVQPPTISSPGWVPEVCPEIDSSPSGRQKGETAAISSWCLFPHVTITPLDGERASVTGTAVFVDCPALQEGLNEIQRQEDEIIQLRRTHIRQGSISKSK